MTLRFLPCAALALLVSPAIAQYGDQQYLGGGKWADAIATGDFDGDGDLDIASGHYATESLVWWENLGGEFAPGVVVYGAVESIRSLEAADLDGDGDTDLLSASLVDGVAWYENLGGGAFGPQRVLLDTVQPATCARAVDLNDDGRLDIVAAGTLGGQGTDVVWHRNLQGQGFGQPAALPGQVLGMVDLDPADVDGDGDPDVLFTSWEDQKVGWYESLDDGSFAAQHLLSVGNLDEPWRVDHADLDGDGDLEVLALSWLEPDMTWFENLGGGVFGAANTETGGIWLMDLEPTDADGDGDLDVILTDHYMETIVILENLGGTFAAVEDVTYDVVVPRVLRAADLDGDADEDLIVGELFGAAWYENLHELGAIYCLGQPNSTGLRGKIQATGSTDVSENAFALGATQLPMDQFGYFLASETQGFVPNPAGSQGDLCLGGVIGRFVHQVQDSGASGTFLIPVDLTDIPGPAQKVVLSGETWSFQAWYRDVNPSPTSNFTSAVAVAFQ